ncbi:MAG: protein-(glutamine-N5) methyltransferase, release factor-specific [Epulopiscium sp. Nuni2H_MBin001]|nr:MAG: protein-(glutamine-N5) methyltransferase, release factor-specific [Epulopiscium sp. Nuni2H_MBin001]
MLLEEKHVSDANIDAKLLLMHVLDMDTMELLTGSKNLVGAEQINEYLNLVNQRGAKEPLQYITKQQEFMGLPFFVDKRVLIPRQDTELLVEAIINMSKTIPIKKAIEVGVGSGCISIALAALVKDISVIGVDISQDALDVALENAKANDVEDKIQFIQSDLFSSIEDVGPVDLIVSNPPYISKTEIDTLMEEVREFEPRIALTDEGDGLKFYSSIAMEAKYYLREGGVLAFEIGHNQAEDVRNILIYEGYKNIELLQDYNSRDRVIIGIMR